MDDNEIAAFIQLHMGDHIGRENALKRKGLLLYLRLQWPNLNDRKMRDVIETMLPEICSCGRGYYLARDAKEARKAIDYLTSYIIALAKRRSAILRKYPEAGQYDLPL